MISLRNWGQKRKHFHDDISYNYRMDGIQGAILNVKLKYLDEMNNKRSEIADFYNANLLKRNLITPKKLNFVDHVWHLYVIKTKQRDRLAQELFNSGIQTIIHYPKPPHRQKCYENIKFKSLKLTDKICSEILSLPLYPNIPISHVEYVVEKINQFTLKNEL